jgi:hypothetical protein
LEKAWDTVNNRSALVAIALFAAFEADYSLSAFVVAYFDLYKLGQGLQIQTFDPAASEADYSRAFQTFQGLD